MTGLRDVTAAVTRGVERLALEMGSAPLREFLLPTGRRVDVMAVDGKGRFWAAEVKSGVVDFRTDHKWRSYLTWCDAFYFAVRPDFPMDLIPQECGLIVADAYGAAVRREPEGAALSPLAGARRKALTLRFARMAAGRLAAGRAADIVESPLGL